MTIAATASRPERASASQARRAAGGARAVRAGLAAEAAAARAYQARGAQVLTTRFKRREGEVDLVVAEGDVTVFVEVKARRDVDTAFAAVTPRVLSRVCAAGARYLAETGRAPNQRVDVAAVDRTGAVRILENVTAGVFL